MCLQVRQSEWTPHLLDLSTSLGKEVTKRSYSRPRVSHIICSLSLSLSLCQWQWYPHVTYTHTHVYNIWYCTGAILFREWASSVWHRSWQEDRLGERDSDIAVSFIYVTQRLCYNHHSMFVIISTKTVAELVIQSRRWCHRRWVSFIVSTRQLSPLTSTRRPSPFRGNIT